MKDEIKTVRLRLRRLTWDDFPFLLQLHADDRVARHLGTGRPRSEAETREWLEKTISWQSQERLGHLGVTLDGDDRLIGRCGLTCMEVENGVSQPRVFWGPGSAPNGVATTPTIELGYAFSPEEWGRGYATEAARHMRDQAFAIREEPLVISLIREDNRGSIRVAEKNGFVHHGTADFFGRIYLRYQLSRAEWERSL